MKHSMYIPAKQHAAPRITSRHLRLRAHANVAYAGDAPPAPAGGMTKQQYDDLVSKFGEDAAKKIQDEMVKLEKALNEKYEDRLKGLLTSEAFEAFKKEELQKVNDALKKLEDAAKTQGDALNKLTGEGGEGGTGKSLEEWFDEQMPKIKAMRAAGAGYFEISSEELRKAGVKHFGPKRKVAAATTIGSSVEAMTGTPASPYLPGLGGTDLEIFDIVRNPNFILNRVDVGRTNQARLAWINETVYDGTPGTVVLEGGTKPLIQHKFKVEFSEAKKAAAYMIFSEEFETDLPGLATALRRMLQADVLRAFDDAIQANVIAISPNYNITGLDGKVPFTTLFDAVGAMIAQIGFNNFTPNTVAINPVTSWQMLMDKDAQGRYLNPPFMDRLNALLVEANKVAVGFALVGDLSQFKVDIYKDFTLRIGWINDQFITNMFSVVGELRYHSYISDARKKALVYNQLLAVQQKITAGS